ncbi:MAG: hypothetical protein ACTSWE_14435, partial [Promethearchaeota archaeon]
LKWFALMSIQNNLSENKNAILRASLCLTGPKTMESVERCIRAKFILQNNPDLLSQIIVSRQLQADFIYKNLTLMELASLLERGVIA